MVGDPLPKKWRWATLAEVQDQRGRAIVSGPFGSNIGSRFFVESGVPVIRGNNLTTDLTRFVEKGFVYLTEEKASEFRNCEAVRGDLVFTAAGSLGQVGIIPDNSIYDRYIISNKQLRARLDATQVLPLFAFYWLSSPEMVAYIQQRNTGSTVPLINLSVLRQLPIPLPTLPEQKRIAEILGSLDDKIELNRKMNETLESMARAIFKSWFVDFDPVVAKSEGRQPDGMDAETAKLFPDSFEDSEIGRIPKGWKLRPADEIADINTWSLGKNDDLDLIEYVEISEVSCGNIGNIQIFERGNEPSRARRRLRHGDTVMSTVRPDRGSYFLCLHPKPSLIASTGFAVLTPVEVPWSYLHAGLTQPEVFEYLGKHADGGAYPAVRPEVIGDWTMCLPNNEDVLKTFHRICVPLFDVACSNRKQTRTLSSVRDLLLPPLLSGEMSTHSV